MMEYSLLCIIRFFFKGACCFAALIMVFYWIFEFAITDEDFSVVDYKNFNQESEILIPEVSLCIENPFIEEKLQEIDPTMTSSKYLEYLKGDIFDEQLNEIDYENVTVNLSNFLLHSTVTWNNGSILMYTSMNETVNHGTYTTFNGFLHNKFVKCFASKLNTQHKGDFNWFQILYVQNTFLNGISTGSPGKGLIVVLHYPNQFLVSTNNVKFFSRSRDRTERFEDESFIMSLYLKDMEILKRRNKRVFPCLEQSDEYDDIIYERHFESIGCQASYHKKQKTNKVFPICNSKEDMKEIMALPSISHHQVENREKHPPPCQIMSRLNFDYEEFDIGQRDSRGLFFGLQYHIPDQFKIIKHSKSITFQSAFGFIGGYVALLLGKYKVQFKVLTILNILRRYTLVNFSKST